MAAGPPAAEVYARVAANRLRAADFFDSLDDGQLATRSLCSEWTVREVLGHLVMAVEVSVGRLLVATARNRGSVDAASVELSRSLARRPVPELTGVLRAKAEHRLRAPGVSPLGQLGDQCLHLRDCARPLGLAAGPPLPDWRLVLDFLPTRSASVGFVPKGRLTGLRLEATDQDWAWGDGEPVRGASEALAMAVAGRAAALPDLAGPGAAILRDRLAGGD